MDERQPYEDPYPAGVRRIEIRVETEDDVLLTQTHYLVDMYKAYPPNLEHHLDKTYQQTISLLRDRGVI